MLLGITISLFGLSLVAGNIGADAIRYIGWGISFVGLVVSVSGYLSSSED